MSQPVPPESNVDRVKRLAPKAAKLLEEITRPGAFAAACDRICRLSGSNDHLVAIVAEGVMRRQLAETLQADLEHKVHAIKSPRLAELRARIRAMPLAARQDIYRTAARAAIGASVQCLLGYLDRGTFAWRSYKATCGLIWRHLDDKHFYEKALGEEFGRGVPADMEAQVADASVPMEADCIDQAATEALHVELQRGEALEHELRAEGRSAVADVFQGVVSYLRCLAADQDPEIPPLDLSILDELGQPGGTISLEAYCDDAALQDRMRVLQAAYRAMPARPVTNLGLVRDLDVRGSRHWLVTWLSIGRPTVLEQRLTKARKHWAWEGDRTVFDIVQRVLDGTLSARSRVSWWKHFANEASLFLPDDQREAFECKRGRQPEACAAALGIPVEEFQFRLDRACAVLGTVRFLCFFPKGERVRVYENEEQAVPEDEDKRAVRRERDIVGDLVDGRLQGARRPPRRLSIPQLATEYGVGESSVIRTLKDAAARLRRSRGGES